jgi:hypothetical protein
VKVGEEKGEDNGKEEVVEVEVNGEEGEEDGEEHNQTLLHFKLSIFLVEYVTFLPLQNFPLLILLPPLPLSLLLLPLLTLQP